MQILIRTLVNTIKSYCNVVCMTVLSKRFALLISTAIFCFTPTFGADSPTSQVNVGIRLGDKTGEEFVDILIPVYRQADRIAFINPRLSLRDEGETEVNLGVGVRKKLFGKDIILGGNVYLDIRKSKFDNRFNQYGAGLELLSNRIDARINYYNPENKQERIGSFNTEEVDIDVDRSVNQSISASSSQSTRVIGSTTTASSDPEYEGNNIVIGGASTSTTTATTTTTRTDVTTTTTTKTTTTTTKRLFEQFERALEGYDAEIGFLLPLPDHAPEVRLFGGYYDFNRRFKGGRDIKGPKGRIEVRAGPYLTFDAEAFEDKELNDTKYFIGARVHIPFGGQNSGKKFLRKFKQSFKHLNKRPIERRLTEQVIRDVRVQTEESNFIENEQQREIDQVVDVEVFSDTQTFVSTDTRTTTNTSRGEDVVLSDAGKEITITHVDSNDGGAGANDGSIENPHTTITDASGSASDIVLIHSDSSFTDQSISVSDDQRLLGEGGGVNHQINTDQLGTIDLPEANDVDGATPTITQTGGGTSITIDDSASNVEIANLNISGGSNGIVSNGTGNNVNINQIMVTNVTGSGISVGQLSGNNIFSQIRISDSGGTAIAFDNAVADARINANDITITNAQRGIAISGALTGSEFVFDNTAVTNSSAQGVSVANSAADVTFIALDVAETVAEGIVLQDNSGVFSLRSSTINVDGNNAVNVLNSHLVVDSSVIKANDADAISVIAIDDKAHNVQISDSTINTSGDFANGVSTRTGGASNLSINLTNSHIDTNGTSANGLRMIARNDSVLTAILDNSSITTSGNLAEGVFASSRNDSTLTATLDTGSSINTSGDNAFGVFATSRNTSTVGITKDNGSTISTSGDNAYGIFGVSRNSSMLSATLNNGSSINTSGNNANGIFVRSLNRSTLDATLDNGSSINTSGNNANGVFANSRDNSTLNATSDNGSSISTSGNDATGLFANADDNSTLTFMHNNNSNITTSGNDAFGVSINSRDNSVLTSILSNGSSISTSGSGANGILINSRNDSTLTTTLNNSSISTSGSSADGVQATSRNDSIQCLDAVANSIATTSTDLNLSNPFSATFNVADATNLSANNNGASVSTQGVITDVIQCP